MYATCISLFLTCFVVFFSIIQVRFIVECILPKEVVVVFLGAFLLICLLPWRWIRYPQGQENSMLLYQVALRSQLFDRKVRLLLIGVYSVIFSMLVFVNIASIGYAYRCTAGIMAIGILVDLVRLLYVRLYYCQTVKGILEYVLTYMTGAERIKDKSLLIEGFETVFSLMTSFVVNADRASLQIFCKNFSNHLDTWLRTCSALSGMHNGLHGDASLLDRYSVIEAMVSKRLAYCVLKAIENGDLFAFEELVHLCGKISLAFHKKHNSLGYLTLISLSQALQGSEGNIDRTAKEVEFITMVSEVIKAYIDITAITHVSDKESIFKSLALLEAHLKESFRLDRKINPAFLMQPFAEIGQLIGEDSYASIPDRDEIVAELRRLLAQFAILEGVRASMDVGVEGTDTKASYHEDKPFLKS